MKLKVLVALLAALLVVGGGAFALTRLLAPAEDEAVAFAPPDSFFYTNVFIRPSNSQRMALDDLLQKLPGIEDVDDFIQEIADALEDAAAEEGFSYEEDIEPWLGDQIAVFVAPGTTGITPSAAFLVESKNDGAAREFLEKAAEEDDVEVEERSYRGEDYLVDTTEDPAGGLVLDGFLVFGTEDGIKAAIDTSQSEETLEDSDAFTGATGPLRDDWIGLFYLDLGAIVEEYAQSPDVTAEDRAAIEAFGFEDQPPGAAVLYVTRNSLVFEASSAGLPGELGAVAAGGGPGLLPQLPGDAWAAFGIRRLGDTISGYLDAFAGVPGFDREQVDALFYGETGLRLDQDVLSWMEDSGFFVQGTNLQDIGGGIVIESNDPAKTRRLVERIQSLAAADGIRPVPESRGGLDGFSVAFPGSPAPFNVLGGDRFVMAYGNDATDAAAGEGAVLQDSEAFRAAQDAVGDDFDIGFFLDVDGAQALGEAAAAFSGAPTDVYEEDWKPWIDVLTHVVYASKTDGDSVVQKFLIGVE